MTKSTPTDMGHPVDLLLPFLENTLGPEEISTVRNHVEKCDHCEQELKSLENITSALKTHKNLFCPEPWEIYEFVQSGTDPDKLIARHLNECSLCKHEAETLQTAPANQKIPERMWSELEQELRQPDVKKATPKAKTTFWKLPNWPLSFLKIPILATATAAAVLVIFLFYPGSQPKPTVALRSEDSIHRSRDLELMAPRQKPDESGGGREASRIGLPPKDETTDFRKTEPAKIREVTQKLVVALSSEDWGQAPGALKLMSPSSKKAESDRSPQVSANRGVVSVGARKEAPKSRVAKIILFDGSSRFNQQGINTLYRAIQPSKALENKCEFIPPKRIQKLSAEGKIKTGNTRELIDSLRTQLDVAKANLITILEKENKYDIKSELFDVGTGKVVQEKSEAGVSEEQLPLRLRNLSEFQD